MHQHSLRAEAKKALKLLEDEIEARKVSALEQTLHEYRVLLIAAIAALQRDEAKPRDAVGLRYNHLVTAFANQLERDPDDGSAQRERLHEMRLLGLDPQRPWHNIRYINERDRP